MPFVSGAAPPDPHREIPFRYFRGEIESVCALVFLFHGRGGSAESVYDQIGKHLVSRNIVAVVPEANCNCWYPYRFSEKAQVNQPWLDSALASIHREVTSFLEQGLQPSQLFFGGFSQGSCLALEYALRHPQRYGGAFCLSGGVIGTQGAREALAANALCGTPIFLGCADEDDWIPREKFEESVTLLIRSGATVESKLYKGLGHSVCNDELTRVRQMIDQVAARKSQETNQASWPVEA